VYIKRMCEYDDGTGWFGWAFMEYISELWDGILNIYRDA
jgi:hypothetical protein